MSSSGGALTPKPAVYRRQHRLIRLPRCRAVLAASAAPPTGCRRTATHSAAAIGRRNGAADPRAPSLSIHRPALARRIGRHARSVSHMAGEISVGLSHAGAGPCRRVGDELAGLTSGPFDPAATADQPGYSRTMTCRTTFRRVSGRDRRMRNVHRTCLQPTLPGLSCRARCKIGCSCRGPLPEIGTGWASCIRAAA